MTNYNDLTQEKKESITKELRDLFEEREKLRNKRKEYFELELIENTTYSVGCSKEQAIIILKEIERQKEIISFELLRRAIKYFQEGEKLAIKIIDEEIEFLKKVFCWSPNADNRIEELKKQREHLEWESGLE